MFEMVTFPDGRMKYMYLARQVRQTLHTFRDAITFSSLPKQICFISVIPLDGLTAHFTQKFMSPGSEF